MIDVQQGNKQKGAANLQFHLLYVLGLKSSLCHYKSLSIIFLFIDRFGIPDEEKKLLTFSKCKDVILMTAYNVV